QRRDSETLREISVFQVDSMIVTKSRPWSSVNWHGCKSVTDRIELERRAQVKRPADCYVRSRQARVRQHRCRRGTQSSIGSGVIAETGGNVNVAAAKRTGL